MKVFRCDNLLWRLRFFSGIDNHVLATILLRLWGIFAGGITILLLPTELSSTQQGYYYTFASLLALQIFFELGFSQVISLMISYEAAHLKLEPSMTLKGNSDRIARVNGIILLLRKWYLVGSILFSLLAWLVGWLFFKQSEHALAISEWLPAWLTVVLFSACNLYLSPQLAVVEGLGRIGQVARLRLIQSAVGYALMWFLLFLGAGLWITLAIPLVSSVFTFFWLRSNGLAINHQADAGVLINWRRDIFPLQWKIAVSWISGYFIFNLMTPVIFSVHGAVEAGRIGMALSIFSAINVLGLSWVNAKNPVFAMHVSRGEHVELNRLFKSVVARSTITAWVLCCLIVLASIFAGRMGFVIADRIASPPILIFLALASIANLLVSAMAIYMRAHMKEPMLFISLFSAVLICITIYALRFNLLWMMFGYAAICVIFTLISTAAIFRNYWRGNLC